MTVTLQNRQMRRVDATDQRDLSTYMCFEGHNGSFGLLASVKNFHGFFGLQMYSLGR